MAKTIEQRLAAQLDENDETIRELESQVEALEEQLRGARNGWAVHRKIDDDHPDLPVPRLEFVWTPSEYGWGNTVAEYRLVRRHMLGHLECVPLGSTKVSSGAGKAPWDYPDSEASPRNWLPFRDGCHAQHDAKHMGLPLFAHGPNGPVRVEPSR